MEVVLNASGFQSTLPARGATNLIIAAVFPEFDFNPRSPHGERPDARPRAERIIYISIHAPRRGSDAADTPDAPTPADISIHAPRTGSDGGRRRQGGHHVYFNPRSPHGERPSRSPIAGNDSSISIHAPRTGSDHHGHCVVDGHPHFNPRSPHGERRAIDFDKAVKDLFQSTLPARGATDQHAPK